MSFTGLVVLLVAFAVIRALAQAGKRARTALDQAREDALRRAHERVQTTTGAGDAAGDADDGPFTLEKVLRQIERVKLEAERQRAGRPARPRRAPAQAWDEAGPLGRRSRVALPSAEEVEDSESLEGPAQITNLEEEAPVAAPRPASRIVRTGSAAARITQRVSVRPAPAVETTPPVIDPRLRPAAADHTGVRTPGVQQLREAFIWREILGPPAALRED